MKTHCMSWKCTIDKSFYGQGIKFHVKIKVRMTTVTKRISTMIKKSNFNLTNNLTVQVIFRQIMTDTFQLLEILGRVEAWIAA